MARIKGHVLAVVLLFFHLLFVPLQALAKPVKGVASWYGKAHAGKRMANGQRFDPRKLTAAHRTLPFGSRIRVKCLETGKQVWVTITDRGPFKRRRMLDVSEGAARVLGARPYGLFHVEIEEAVQPEPVGD